MFDSDILNENNELEGDSDKEKSESGRKGSSRKKSSFEFDPHNETKEDMIQNDDIVKNSYFIY